MSTPEQLTLIRHAIHYRELRYADKERELTDALIAVLADAERFAALEAAHLNPPFKGSIAVKVFDPESFEYVLYKGELSELADRLKNEGTK